jgi:hypothetical protein
MNQPNSFVLGNNSQLEVNASFHITTGANFDDFISFSYFNVNGKGIISVKWDFNFFQVSKIPTFLIGHLLSLHI